MRLLTYPASLLVKARTTLSREYSEFLCNLVLQAFLKGYTQDNIRFLVAQSINESAYGTSKVYLDDANAWGMGCVRVRENLQIGCRQEADGGQGVGRYASVADSTKCRFLWDEWYGISPKSPNYAALVFERGYNASSAYLPALAGISQKYYDATRLALLMTAPLELSFVIFLMLRAKSSM